MLIIRGGGSNRGKGLASLVGPTVCVCVDVCFGTGLCMTCVLADTSLSVFDTLPAVQHPALIHSDTLKI